MNKGFWVHFLLDPFTALDLTDKEGRADHGKVLPAILLLSAIIAQFMGKQFSAAVLIVLGSLSYGYGGWRAFLKSKTVLATEQLLRQDITNKTEITVNKREEKILSRRNVQDGIDPTYE